MSEKSRAYPIQTHGNQSKEFFCKRARGKTRKAYCYWYCSEKISIPSCAPGFSKSRIILPFIHHYFLTFSFYAGAATLPQKGLNTCGETNNPQSSVRFFMMIIWPSLSILAKVPSPTDTVPWFLLKMGPALAYIAKTCTRAVWPEGNIGVY